MTKPESTTAVSWYDPGRLAPWLVLIISLATTYLLWQQAHRSSIQEQRIAFDSQVNDIIDRLHRQIAYSEQVLYGVRSFYINQHKVERQEFNGYIDSLDIEKNFPGIQGISFAPLISDSHKSDLIGSLRKSGLPDYTIKPEGHRDSYAPVTFIAPPNQQNSRALGFDNLIDPARKATIEQARDEDRVVISEKLVLRQENQQAPQPGFLMFLPVYQRGAAHDNLRTNRANIRGWFAASFRMKDMMGGVLDEHSTGIELAIFDGDTISPEKQMFGPDDGAKDQSEASYTTTVPVDLAGHNWTMQFHSLPVFEQQRDTSAEHKAVLAGGLFWILLSMLTWQLMRERQRELQANAAISRELDVRKQAEHQIRDLLIFNEAILEASPSGIAVFNLDGNFLMANTAYAKAFDTTVESVLQQNFHQSPAWKRIGLIDFAMQSFTSKRSIRCDVEMANPAGEKVVLDCILAPIDISTKHHIILILNDVSEREKSKLALTDYMQQLEQKEMAKTRFLAAAGHDLRQPLAAANLFIDTLKLTAVTPHQDGIIQRLDQVMGNFTGLLDALLNISKLDAGIIKPEYAAVDVIEIFNWLEQSFAPVANEKQLAFRLYFPVRTRLIVRSDIGLLKSVLMNLVSNAIKFTTQGTIMVSARLRRGEVLFQVWDSGIGISDDQIGKIFDEFYQVDNPQRDRTSGIGLGLSITKRALALMGSEIKCRSFPGRGSVFEFRQPLECSTHDNTQQNTAGNRHSGAGIETFASGKRFVVMEDDALVTQAMSSWLEGMGGEAICFHSAEEALRHAGIEDADYYIVDCMLTGKLNGIEFLNHIREKRGENVKAVIVTGDTSTSFICQAADSGWPVLHKPINTAKLISTLNIKTAQTSL